MTNEVCFYVSCEIILFFQICFRKWGDIWFDQSGNVSLFCLCFFTIPFSGFLFFKTQMNFTIIKAEIQVSVKEISQEGKIEITVCRICYGVCGILFGFNFLRWTTCTWSYLDYFSFTTISRGKKLSSLFGYRCLALDVVVALCDVALSVKNNLTFWIFSYAMFVFMERMKHEEQKMLTQTRKKEGKSGLMFGNGKTKEIFLNGRLYFRTFIWNKGSWYPKEFTIKQMNLEIVGKEAVDEEMKAVLQVPSSWCLTSALKDYLSEITFSLVCYTGSIFKRWSDLLSYHCSRCNVANELEIEWNNGVWTLSRASGRTRLFLLHQDRIM